MDEPFADLVFEGGGVKGIGLAGAYSALCERGVGPKRVAGTVDEEAAGKLDKLGLDVELDAVGGLFDELRSGPRRVCESDPPAGTEVEPGSRVTLKTAKTC